MAITRIKNNQITDSTIDGGTKLVNNSITAGKLENDLTYGSNLTVTGNLTVNGTTTTISTTNTTVEDPVLVLASQQTGSGAVDIGFIGERGTDNNVAFVWDESVDKFVAGFVSDAESNTTVTFTADADMKVGTLETTGTSTFDSLSITNDLSVGGATNLTGLLSADGGIDVDGAFTVADTTGNISTSGTLGVTGTSTLGTVNAGAVNLTGLLSADGGIDVDGAFTVADTTGNVSTTGTLTAANTTINGTLDVTGLSSLDGGIDVDGAFTVADTSGNVNTSGTLTVGSTADFNGSITAGDITIDATSTLDAGANKWTNLADPTSAQDAATKSYVDSVAAGGFTLQDDAGVPNTTTISAGDTLTVNGTANEVDVLVGVDALTIGLPSDVTISNDLTITGVTNAAGVANLDGGIAVDTSNFTVNGTTGAVSTASTLDVAGLASLDGGIDVDGAFTVADTTGNISTSGTLSVTGGATVSGLLDADGGIAVDTNAFTVADTTGNTNIGGTLDVTGESTLASATVSDLTDNRIVIAGTAGSLEDDANLTFDGTTFEVGTLFDVTAASGNTVVGGTLDVTGLASLDGGIDVDGAFTVADTTGNISTSGTLDVTGDTTLKTTEVSDIVVVETITNDGSLTIGASYEIVTVGTSDFTTVGASANTVGTIFTASGTDAGGNGTVKLANAIDMGSNRVTNVQDPTQAQDAATKAYVDGLTGGFTLDDGTTQQTITNGDTLTVNGTTNEVDVAVSATDTLTIGLPDDVTITNNLTVSNDLGVTGTSNVGILNATGLASLDGGIDVDGAFTVADTSGNVSTTGTLNADGLTTLADVTIDASSTIDMGGNEITNIAEPTAATSAASKNYVDNRVTSGTVWRDPIRDPDLVGVTATEPVSPQTGAGYIATASGTWTGSVAVSNGTYVYWTGSAWIFVQDIVAGNRLGVAMEHGTIESSLYDLGFRGGDILSYQSGAYDSASSWNVNHDAGYQVIDFVPEIASGDSTGLANDATVYVLDVSTDVGSGETLSQIQVTGSTAQTFGDLITEINTDLDATFGAGNVVASIPTIDGHIHIENVAAGNRVTIKEGTAAGTGMLATLNNFNEVLAGTEDGTTVIVNDPDSNHYSHTYTYSHEGNTWTEIAGPGAIDAGNQLAYDGNTLNVLDGSGSGLDGDLLDGQEGSYYLDWTNTTNKPDPTITLGGDATGSITLTDLGGGTLTVTVVDDSHNHIISNVDGLQTALDGKLDDTGDTMNGAYTVSAGGSISWATSPSVGSHLTNKDYVDGLISAGFDITDGTTTETISGSDTLTVNGTANEVEVAVSATDTLTIGLPDNVTIGGTLDVTSTLTATGLSNLNGGIAVDTSNFTVSGTTGAVSTASTLDVAGLASLDGGIDVDGAFTVANTSGNISTTGTSNVDGTATFNGDITMTGGVGDVFLIQDGASGTSVQIASDTGNTTINGTLDVAGLASLDGGIDVDGAFTVADTSGNTNIGGTLTVTGTTDLNGLLTAGDITIDAASTLDAGANKWTNLADPTVAQDAATKAYVDSQITSGFTISDDAGVPNTSTISGGDTLTFNGTTNEVEVLVSGDSLTIGLPDSVTITSALTVGGIANLNGGIAVDTSAFTVADTTGNTSIGGTLDVTGVTTTNALLNADGGIAVDTSNFTVSGTTGAVSTASTLDVAGLASLDGGIDVDSNFTVADTSGNTVINGTLDVNSQADLVDTNIVGAATVSTSLLVASHVDIDANGIQAASGTGLTINPDGTDYNTRIKGLTNDYLFFADAGKDAVSIGGSTIPTDVTFEVDSTDSVILSKGTTGERPSVGVEGMMRYNTTLGEYEFYDGSNWNGFGTEFTVIASETFSGDGSTTGFTLSSSQTTASCIVSINGVIQIPTTAYSVSGTTLTFTEAPASGDTIEVRELTTTSSVNAVTNGTADFEANGSQFDLTGHIIPTTTETYDLGSATYRFRDLYLAGTTIHLGADVQIKNDAGTVKFVDGVGDPVAVDLGTTLDPDVTIDGGSF